MGTKVSARVYARKHINWERYDGSGCAEPGDPGYPESKDRVPGVVRAPPGGDRGGPGARGSYQPRPGARGGHRVPEIATSGHGVLRSGAQIKFPQPYLSLLSLSCNKIKILYPR